MGWAHESKKSPGCGWQCFYWARLVARKNPRRRRGGGGPKEARGDRARARGGTQPEFCGGEPYLELGGTLYGYADIDGDPEKLATALRQVSERLAATQPDAAVYLKQDYAQLFTELGLTDVKALGFSSVPAAGGGFRNRAFFYTPSGRHGLLAGLGGPAVPFKYCSSPHGYGFLQRDRARPAGSLRGDPGRRGQGGR